MARPGRKRKVGVRRTKAGRIARIRAGKDIEHMGQVEVRMAHYDLSEEQALDQKAGSVVGRLRLKGELSEAQWLAAEEWLRLHAEFKQAVKAPDALRNGTGAGGDLPETRDYREWCELVVEAYGRAERAILRANGVQGMRYNCPAAIDLILERDQELPHLVPDLGVALTALALHFGHLKAEREALTESGLVAA